MEKRFRPLVASSLLVLVSVSAWLLFSSTQKPRPPTAPAETASGSGQRNPFYDPTATRNAENLAKYAAAVDSADPDACGSIEEDRAMSSRCRDNAFAALASKKADPSFCAKISDIPAKARCDGSFAYDRAVTAGDAGACERIEDLGYRTACVRKVTFDKIEAAGFSGTAVDACGPLQDAADKEYCRTRISKAASVVTMKAALAKNDSNLCSEVADRTLRSTCSDAITLQKAIAQKSSGSCDAISDSTKRAQCHSAVAKIDDARLFQEAVASGIPDSCARITGAELRTKCSDVLILKSAVASKNASKCPSIVDSTLRSQCSLATASR